MTWKWLKADIAVFKADIEAGSSSLWKKISASDYESKNHSHMKCKNHFTFYRKAKKNSTPQKMKFSIKDFSGKCDQIHMKLGIL